MRYLYRLKGYKVIILVREVEFYSHYSYLIIHLHSSYTSLFANGYQLAFYVAHL